MNKTNLLFAGILAFTSTTHAASETSNVFCGTLNGSNWYWLKDASNSQVTVSGERGVYLKNNLHYRFFSISEADYLSFNTECRSGYVAQPAMGFFDGWYNFKLVKPDNSSYFAPGYTEGIRNLEGSWTDFRGSWSDIGLKQAIQPLQNSLEKISLLGGYSYTWRDDSVQKHLSGKAELGVIAQEVQAVFPELVTEGTDGYLRVDYQGLIPVLLESIKELNSRIEVLENREEVVNVQENALF